MEEAISSKFNINFVREVFIVGDPKEAESVRKLLKGFHFLHVRHTKDVTAYRDDIHFVLALADFTSDQGMQAAAKLFAASQSPLAHRLVNVVAPNGLSREQLLFCQEIGARHVFVGPARNDDLKEYLKRVNVEAHQVGSLAVIEQELAQALAQPGITATQKFIQKLKTLPEGEDVLRLLIQACMHANDLKRAESSLKRLLQLNPQNLWAANSLGKLYLRSGRAAQGMETLAKLSRFHELNSERLLTLGTAQVVAGRTEAAAATFDKGDKLTGGTDPRFKDGLAQTKLAGKDTQGALACLGGRAFSPDVLSFLNMRAILSSRDGCYAEALDYYGCALKGAGTNADVRARLYFNMGLAYVRTGELQKALDCFRESCALGGPGFQRAKGPLQAVAAAVKGGQGAKTKAGGGAATPMKLDDAEWETLF